MSARKMIRHYPNVAKWIEELRTTTAGQASNFLCLNRPTGRAYCCLGVGSSMVPTIKQTLNLSQSAVTFDGLTSLAPRSFIEWLGVDDPQLHFRAQERDRNAGEYVAAFDVVLDWPENLLMFRHHEHFSSALVTGAGLNDNHFTFKQIADLFDYFGVVGGFEEVA